MNLVKTMLKETSTEPQKSVMTGGPGQPTLESKVETPTNEKVADKPAEFELEYEGRKLKSDDLKKELETFSDFKKTYGKQQNEIGTLRKELAELKGYVNGVSVKNEPKVSPYEDVADAFFEAPPKGFEKFEEKLSSKWKADLDKVLNDVRTSNTQAETYRKMWDGFYEKNEDLKPFKNDIVPYITERLNSEISELPAEQAFKVLADESRKAILELKKRVSLYGAEEVHAGKSISERPGSRGPKETKDDSKTLTVDDYRKSVSDTFKKIKKFRPSYETL